MTKHQKGKETLAGATHWGIARIGITEEEAWIIEVTLWKSGEVYAFDTFNVPRNAFVWRTHLEEWLCGDAAPPIEHLPWWLRVTLEDVFSREQ